MTTFHYPDIYINGSWTSPCGEQTLQIINPATEEVVAQVPHCNHDDLNAAVAAARQAFPDWSATTSEYRTTMLLAVADEMERRLDDLTTAHVLSMGCPQSIAVDLQVRGPIEGLRSLAQRAGLMDEQETGKGVIITREAVGVCAFINPWNYPLHQFVGKVAAALAAGCTVVAKPSEKTPLQDFIMAEIFHEVGLPAGVFNLVSGTGKPLGELMAQHGDIDMVSFTGSTAVGEQVALNAASGSKRVCLELGGKSPLIITEDAELEAAVRFGVENVMLNSGQTCDALTRMLIPQQCYDEAVTLAKAVAEEQVVGDPLDEHTTMGPLSCAVQKQRVINYIALGIEEGACLVTGGIEMPKGVTKGAYVKPTIFAEVRPDMRIAQEEIFGPVLCLIPYRSIDDAIAIANDSRYGLSSGVYAKDAATAMDIAKRLRAGQCYIQGAYFNYEAPFGGYKNSGNGREWGDHGVLEYAETKALVLP